MTLRPLRRYYRLKEEKPQAEVTIFPEGGAWVEGVSQRLAFEANSTEGEHLNGMLIVYDSHDIKVAWAETEHRGRGTVEMTAKAGENYHAEFHWGNGLSSKVDLPQQEKQGVAMKVDHLGDSLIVKVSRQGNVPQELGLTVMTNGIVCHRQNVREDRLSIDTDKLPTGVAQLTLFDSEGQVYADRLTFVRHEDLQLENVIISGLPEQGNPLEKVTLMVEAPVQTTLSVAVRDLALTDPLYDSGTLLTEILLGSQVKGFIEDPGWYFQSNDKEHSRALDLLMMVQGWRRFSWKEMTQAFQLEEPFEKYPIIRGDVSRYSPMEQEDYFCAVSIDDPGTLYRDITSRGTTGPVLCEPLKILDGMSHDFIEGGVYCSFQNDPADYQWLSPLKEEVSVHTEFSAPSLIGEKDAVGDMTTSQGKFSFQAPTANGYYYCFLASFKPGGETSIVTNADEYPDYSLRVRPFHPRFVKPYDYYQTHLRPFSQREKGMKLDEGITEMKEVAVGARRGGLRGFDKAHPALVLDAYDAFNQVVDAGLSPAWYAGSLSFSLNTTRLFIGDMGVKRSYQLERRWNGKNISSFLTPHEQLKYNHLRNLQKVSIYTDYAPRLEGDRRYQASDQPVVTINLDLLPDDAARSNYRDRFYVQSGYSVCEKFYQPNYSQAKLPKDFRDYRRTLYWNPNLHLDESGRATISFYNNSRQNQFSVSVEGITEKGMILTGEGGANN